MYTVKEMISRMRNELHDTHDIEYTETELLHFLNDAVSMLRRTAMRINPSVLITTKAGSTKVYAGNSGAGCNDHTCSPVYISSVRLPECDCENDIPEDAEYEYRDYVDFPGPIMQLIQVTVNGVPIEGIDITGIDKYCDSGIPEAYYIEGFKRVRFCPSPDDDYKYCITYVDDTSLFDISDVSPFPTGLDDLLLSYAEIKAGMTNEFDESADSQMLMAVLSQVEGVLIAMVPQHIHVSGYWDSGTRRGKYGSRW